MPEQPPPPILQAVLFDYGLVLSGPPDPLAWERLKKLLHAEESVFHAAYWRWRHDYDRGALTGERYWRKVAADLGQPIEEPTLQALDAADIDLWTRPNPPMIAWAAALQAAGVRTGILSNLGDAMERGVLARCPWLNAFDHHTFSNRLNTAKPDPSIYAHAAQGLRVHPANILFIDDREENIRAARAAGMQAILYVEHTAFATAMQAAGHNNLLTLKEPSHTA